MTIRECKKNVFALAQAVGIPTSQDGDKMFVDANSPTFRRLRRAVREVSLHSCPDYVGCAHPVLGRVRTLEEAIAEFNKSGPTSCND
jgi:hypothetical protein